MARMPLYDGLRAENDDTAGVRKDKRRTAANLRRLRDAMKAHFRSQFGEVEARRRGTLRLATWNIREFDSSKYGERMPESRRYIAEIIAQFDLVAVQEVREDLGALKDVMRMLGPDWRFIATDVTEGTGGNRERMAFLYDKRRVWFRNIAGELVLKKASRIKHPSDVRLRFAKGIELELPEGTHLKSPHGVHTYKRSGKHRLKEEAEVKLPAGTWVRLPDKASLVLPAKQVVELDGEGGVVLPAGDMVTLEGKLEVDLPKSSFIGDALQFARTPFVVSFQAGWLKLNLCTVHIYYGKGNIGLKRRNQEIRRLTEMLAKRAVKDAKADADTFFVVLGDFNIVGKHHETMKSLRTNGFDVPEALEGVPGSNVKQDKAYDQIAYWTDPDGPDKPPEQVASMEVVAAGVFDYFDHVFRTEDEPIYAARMAKMQKDGGAEEGATPWKYRDWRTYQMSDHLPMWIELRTDFADEFLNDVSR